MQRAITAIYRTYDVADLVRNEIADLGVSRGYIHVVPDREDTVAAGSIRDNQNYMDDLHDLHLPADELRTYQQAVRRGDYVVSANVDDDYLDRVTDIMRRPEDAYDLDATHEEFSSADYIPHSTGTTAYGAEAFGHENAGSYRGSNVETGSEQVIPVAEEQMRVGKREVERGSVHVRSYVREMPVEERVSLRDEHVSVERRPATGAAVGADAFQERTIDVTETDEEAVISKEAVVTEEVVVRKDADVREEVVSDTVRKTEVEVDDDRTTTRTDRDY